MSSDANKLVDLEIKLGFLERTVEQLNEVVTEQATTLEQFARHLKLLEQRLASKQDGGGQQDIPDPLDEKPPHY